MVITKNVTTPCHTSSGSPELPPVENHWDRKRIVVRNLLKQTGDTVCTHGPEDRESGNLRTMARLQISSRWAG